MQMMPSSATRHEPNDNGNDGAAGPPAKKVKHTKCPLHGCKRVFTDTPSYQMHIKDHEIPTQSLPGKKFICTSLGCSKTLPSMKELMEHMREHHKPSIYFLCESCRAKLRSLRGLLAHLQACSKVRIKGKQLPEPMGTQPQQLSEPMDTQLPQPPEPMDTQPPMEAKASTTPTPTNTTVSAASSADRSAEQKVSPPPQQQQQQGITSPSANPPSHQTQPMPRPSENAASHQTQPVVRQTQPAARQIQPVVRQTQPAAHQSQPVARQTQPGACQNQPVVRQTQPGAHQSQPAARQTQPAARQNQPVARQTQPAARQTQPAARQNQPVARQTQPAAHQSQPVGRQTQPGAHQSQPVARQTQPAARQTQPVVRKIQPAPRPSGNPAPRQIQPAPKPLTPVHSPPSVSSPTTPFPGSAANPNRGGFFTLNPARSFEAQFLATLQPQPQQQGQFLPQTVACGPPTSLMQAIKAPPRVYTNKNAAIRPKPPQAAPAVTPAVALPSPPAPQPAAGSSAVWKQNQDVLTYNNRRVLWVNTKGSYRCVQCDHCTPNRKDMTAHLKTHQNAPTGRKGKAKDTKVPDEKQSSSTSSESPTYAQL